MIDEKLKVILRSYDASPSDVPKDMFDKEATEIKQAFIEAGHGDVKKTSGLTYAKQTLSKSEASDE